MTPDIVETLKEMPARSGCYQWIFAFQGEIQQYSPEIDFEKYDIVQVNGAPIDFPVVHKIREHLGNSSSTKLVVNNDYVSEAWEARGVMPALWERAFKDADMIFGTEPHQASMLGDKAFVLPHPTNVRQLKHFRVAEKYDKPVISSIYHWWSGNVWNMYNATKDLGAHSQLVAYVKDKDKFLYTRQLFNELVGPKKYEDYAEELLRSTAAVDLSPFHTYGRNTVDLACFKVPHIVSDRIYSANVLGTNLQVDPYDIWGARKRLKDVLANREYILDEVQKAYEKVEYFNHKNSVKRYLAALDLAEQGKHGGIWDEKKDGFDLEVTA